MMGIIDRFEGDFAIVEFEGRKMTNVVKALLPLNAKEGDVIELQNGVYVLNLNETKKRAKEIERLSEELWEK